jgi:hypothetical protein
MIRDRDRIYGSIVTRRLHAMGIRDKPTAPVSPWQNGFAERLIGSIRRECLDHIVVFGEAHLRRNSAIIRALLQRHQDPSITGQGCAGFSPGSADREHQIVPDPGRTPSPLRPGVNFRYTRRVQASDRPLNVTTEMLILAAEGQRPVMFADIAVRRALHAGEPASTPTPQRKPART